MTEQTTDDNDDPFVTFSEWSGEADEKAYATLEARKRACDERRVGLSDSPPKRSNAKAEAKPTRI